MKFETKMKKAAYVILFFVFISVAGVVYAHQPRLVIGPRIVEVKDPETSQAFYSELKGESQIFQIKEEKSFDLYLNILAPDLPEARTDFVVYIYKKTDKRPYFIDKLDGENFTWQKYHEEFANDDYLKGPEWKKEVEAGSYLIEVKSKDNQGKYSLAIGEKEKFTLSEIKNVIRILPDVKTQIFNKPAYTAFTNRTGIFLLLPFLSLVIIIALAIFIYKKFKK